MIFFGLVAVMQGGGCRPILNPTSDVGQSNPDPHFGGPASEMTVRGYCGDWSVNSCVVDEWTRQSQEWQHLLVVVWYCVPELPLQGLSRVTAFVINVMVRCWEMPQPIGGSNGGAWGQSWRFICGPFVRKHVDDWRCWNRQDTNSRV